MGYKHLNIDEREVILKMRAEKTTMQQIGENLGRSAGTISRELSRNTCSTSDYKPHLAQRYYHKRRTESKSPYRLEEDVFLRKYVEKKLQEYWSPEQISDGLRTGRRVDISPLTILKIFSKLFKISFYQNSFQILTFLSLYIISQNNRSLLVCD